MRVSRSWSSIMNHVLLSTAFVLCFCFICVHSSTLKKRDIAGYGTDREKKPFCNAFTGCGKKRSSPEGLTAATDVELDELARHVLAEARLWEQLQSKVEMMRTLASQMEESRPVFRRRRSAPPLPSDFHPKDYSKKTFKKPEDEEEKEESERE